MYSRIVITFVVIGTCFNIILGKIDHILPRKVTEDVANVQECNLNGNQCMFPKGSRTDLMLYDQSKYFNHNQSATLSSVDRRTERIDLNPSEIDNIIELAMNITATASSESLLFVDQTRRMAEQLPVRIKYLLNDFATRGNKNGMLLISKIPIDESALPPTPPGNKFHVGETTQLARIQAIMNYAYGYMVGYEAEGFGKLFQDMVPREDLKTSQTSLGSKVELEIHTEQAFSKLRPDIVSLACLRGDPEAKTYVLPVNMLLEHLSQKDIELLRQPNWITGVDMSFKMNDHAFIDGDVRGPMPIISGSLDDPHLLFDQDLMVGTDDESQNMIKRIVDIYTKFRLQHILQPGEIVLVDNRRAVHGRSPFNPRFDGTDRFIVRSFGVFDYEMSAYGRPDGGTMIEAKYS